MNYRQNLHVLSVLSLILFMFINCTKSDPLLTYYPENCQVNNEAEDERVIPCNMHLHLIDTNRFCKTIAVEDEMFLSDRDREWMPYWCFEEGDKIYFENEFGIVNHFQVLGFGHKLLTAGYFGNDECEDDPEKENIYCMNIERIWGKLLVREFWQQINFRVEVAFDSILQLPIKKGLLVRLEGGKVFNSRTIVKKNRLGMIDAQSLIFEDVKRILDTDFYNVYTAKNLSDNKEIEFYFNKEFGIVGFRDDKGLMWKLRVHS
jgi:hypothetical protein